MQNKFIKEALIQAKKAMEQDEVPVGAIIVKNNKIIAKAHNLTETLQDPTAHAEILAIRRASKALNSWRLNECEMYVTLEPCPMCAGAIIQSRIRKIYVAAIDPNVGACGSVINILQNRYLNSMIDVKWIYNKESSNILQYFFKNKRNK
ncbi:nucleoside deaminase [Haloimpatiens sp. FM7330]|uniref:nucleoside deaminase n=1 Tax=Haloimpatiens sp. FM7330 TaxID=3298610 RepID=UPI00362D0949